MERKVGEIFEFGGEWYQCIVGNGCKNCAFNDRTCYTLPTIMTIGDCCSERRTDKYSVIFKKLEKVGKPYPNADKLYQLYILPMNIEKLPTHTEGINLVRFDIVEIEIKPTKEDMEEKKLNLKPFDFQKARAGKPVCTRDGRKARIICFDYNGSSKVYPIVALVEYKNESGQTYEQVCKYMENGRYKSFHGMETESEDDLMMLSEKKE